jgi:hypothetical protein
LERLLLEDIGSADKINSYGIIALLHWRRNEPELAHHAAEAAIHWIAQSSPTGFGIIHGYTNVAEVCLAMWEEEGAGVGGRGSDQIQSNEQNPKSKIVNPKSNAGQTCQALHQYARAFPIGRPCAWLWQGLYDWQSGRPRRAHAAWRKSMAEAERLAMPYEQALALYEMGRHLPAHDPNRRAHLTHAIEIFSQLQASYDLNRAQQALAAGGNLRN